MAVSAAGQRSPRLPVDLKLFQMAVAARRTVATSGPVATVSAGFRSGNPKGQHHQSHKAQHSFRDRFHTILLIYFQIKPLVLTIPTLRAVRKKAIRLGLDLDQENTNAKKQSRRIGEPVFDSDRREPIQNWKLGRNRGKG